MNALKCFMYPGGAFVIEGEDLVCGVAEYGEAFYFRV